MIRDRWLDLVRRVGLAALGLVIAGCGGAQSRYADHVARGERYLDESNLPKAGLEFRNAAQVAPKSAHARYLLGRVAERSGDLRLAAAHYRDTLELDGDDVDAAAALGKLYAFGGAPGRALEILSPVIARHPDSPALLTARAAARSQNKDGAGALQDAERSVALAPDREDSITLLAALLNKAGENPRATALVWAAIKKHPASVDLTETLASLYLAAGDRVRTETALRRLVELQPKRPEPSYRLAFVLAKFERLDDAQKVLEEAVKRLPDDQSVKLTLADFITTQRSRAEGEKVLRSYIAQNPKDLDLRLGLGALLERSGAAVEAMAAYREIIDQDPRGPKAIVARDRMAMYEVSSNHLAAAQDLIDEVLRSNPRDTDALVLRGTMELKRGDPTAAVADLRAVVRDLPGATKVQRELARAHLALGEPQLAEEALRNALSYAPGDIAVRIDLAQLLGRSDRIDAAIVLLEEGVRRAPQDSTAREALVRAYLARHDYAAARGAAEELKTLLPKSPLGWYLAGIAAEGEHKLDDAERELVDALKLQPTSVDILAQLVQTDSARGHRSGALLRVLAVVDANPRDAGVRNLYGELLAANQQNAASLEQFRIATELAPTWPVPWRNLSRMHRAAGESAAAIADDEAGLKAAPNEPLLIAQLATLYEEQHRIDDAMKAYETLLAARPNVEVAANNLAMLLLSYRSDLPSLERAEALTAVFANSPNPELLDTHGWALYKRGKYAESLAAIERAAAKAPKSQVISYHLGMAQLKAGEPDKARVSLEAAVASSARFEGSDEAATTLAQLRKSAG